MLHARETWPLTKPDLKHLRGNNTAMIRQICNVKSEDVATIISKELLAHLEIDDLEIILRVKRLCCFGHVELNAPVVQSRQPATYRQMESVGQGGPRCHGRH